MYVATQVIESRFQAEKYPVAGLHGEITCIFVNQSDAAKQAKKWLTEGRDRSTIICRFASKNDILAQIEKNIQYYQDRANQFNSQTAITEALKLQAIKNEILVSMS